MGSREGQNGGSWQTNLQASPDVDTGEMGGPFSERGEGPSRSLSFSAEQMGARRTLLFGFADVLSSKTSSSPVSSEQKPALPAGPLEDLAGCGPAAQLSSSWNQCRLLVLKPCDSENRYRSSRRLLDTASPSAFSSRSRTCMPPLPAPASEAAERLVERDETQECLELPRGLRFSVLFSFWWNLLILRHGS